MQDLVPRRYRPSGGLDLNSFGGLSPRWAVASLYGLFATKILAQDILDRGAHLLLEPERNLPGVFLGTLQDDLVVHRQEEMAVPAFPLDDASDQEPGRSREEQRSSRFAAAIAAAADSWGEAVSSNDMADERRFGLLDAALDLSDCISERVEEGDWDVIPNEERLEIVTTMEKLGEAAERGLRHLQETAKTRAQAEQVKQRRQQMREWTRSTSA